MVKCNSDCFNCIYIDCVADKVKLIDIGSYLGFKESYWHLYYQDHKESINERSKAYYQAHKAERLEYQKKRYIANRERLKKYQREYYWRCKARQDTVR